MNYRDVLEFWRRKKISNSADLEFTINGKIIALAYHSTKIENDLVTYNDTRSIFEHDSVSNFTGDLRTIYEIRNSKDAFNGLLESFDQKLPLDRDLILRFHFQLTKDTYDKTRLDYGESPGSFKKRDYIVGRDEVGALPEDVEIEIGELLDELIDVRDSQILKAAAYFHCKFENIHPFADGNGRTGRLAMNYFLILHDYPPTIIFEQDRNEYFSALEEWDSYQEILAMINFLENQTLKTWQKNLSR